MIVKIFFILFLVALLINNSCTQKKKEKELLKIILTSEITDTVPFCPHVWSAEFDEKFLTGVSKNTSMDSVQEGKFEFLQYTYDKIQEELPVMSNSIKAIKGKKNGKRAFGLDTNNDGIIDKNEIFDFESIKNKYIRIKNVDQFIQGKIVKKDFEISPIESRIYSSSGVRKNINKTIDFRIKPTYMLAEHNFKGVVYKIAAFPPAGNFRKFRDKGTQFYISKKEFPFKSCISGDPLYKIGDTVNFNSVLYKLNNIDSNGKYLLLDSVGIAERSAGINVGDIAYKIEGDDILTNKVVLEKKEKKYILLDFWGSWCEPCIKLTPELKGISQLFDKSEFEIIGIAFDNSKDKVEKYLIKEQVFWQNIYDDQANSIITEKYKIVSFPTFILISPEGVILKRGTSKEALDDILDYLKKDLKLH